jgi:hypothetical protein
MQARQLRDIIIVPSLTAIGHYSSAAVNLLLGTCAQESHMGHYIIQKRIGMNGGIGIYQMQKPTFDDVWDRTVMPNIAMKAKIRLLLGYEGRPNPDRMASDLSLATVMARLFYSLIPELLPKDNDIEGMARYYKQYYNTPLGKATELQFKLNYIQYVQKDIL